MILRIHKELEGNPFTIMNGREVPRIGEKIVVDNAMYLIVDVIWLKAEYEVKLVVRWVEPL